MRGYTALLGMNPGPCVGFVVLARAMYPRTVTLRSFMACAIPKDGLSWGVHLGVRNTRICGFLAEQIGLFLTTTSPYNSVLIQFVRVYYVLIPFTTHNLSV